MACSSKYIYLEPSNSVEEQQEDWTIQMKDFPFLKYDNFETKIGGEKITFFLKF